MCRSVATNAIQVHGVYHAPSTRLFYGIASLFRPFVDLKLLPAVLKHFWHEGKTVQHALLIKRGKNGLATLHPNCFTRVQAQNLA
ncbi:MAG: hypothetical protein KF682_00735 [Nitrospira sp.]|nr:hypothetical protein [Nitrospira sp.]